MFKNKDTWMTYIIKIVIGYHGNIDTDGEEMANEIGDYVGTTYDECRGLYNISVVKRMTSIIEISKNVFAKKKT